MLKSSQLISVFSFARTAVTLRSMASLPKVIVRNSESDESIQLSFKFGTNELAERQFNFRRDKNEAISSFFTRISANLTSAISRKKKNKKGDAPSVSEIKDIQLLSNGVPVNKNVKNGEAWMNGDIFCIGDVKYEVNVNAPTITKLSFPKSIMAGFPVYPKIELEFANKEDCIFTWYRTFPKEERRNSDDEDMANSSDVHQSKMKEYWKKVGTEYVLLTDSSFIGKKLKVSCIPKNGDQTGLEVTTEATVPVDAGPGPCPFDVRHQYCQNLTGDTELRLVSYNILADLYADSDYSRGVLFPYCPPYALAIDYRKQLILKELLGYNADLICLQEVDKKIFENDLKPLLETANMDGIFNVKGGQVVEGLSCFYRKTKLRYVESTTIILSEVLKTEPVFADVAEQILKNEKLAERLLARTTAVQYILLESKIDPSRQILLANTHLYFHPDADHIRLLQAYLALKYLEQMYGYYKQKDQSKNISVLLFGDFNSCPEFGVYQLMTTGLVPEDCQDWNSNPEEAATGITASHSFQLASACGCPQYTNFTTGFAGCLDYIFYDKNTLSVSEVVPLPSHEEVTQHVAIPNIVFPSDHLALVCTVKWN